MTYFAGVSALGSLGSALAPTAGAAVFGGTRVGWLSVRVEGRADLPVSALHPPPARSWALDLSAIPCAHRWGVFVEVFRNLQRYDPARPLRPWLFAFAFRFASDYRRLARHRVEVYEEHSGTSADPAADDVIAARELRTLVAVALESIELVRRSVFILHELDARPMVEIARSLGIPLNTAYSRLRVAREEFTATFRLLQRGRP